MKQLIERKKYNEKRKSQRLHLQKQNRLKRREQCANFLTALQFENTLPPIPFPPKVVRVNALPGGPKGLATYFLPELDYQRNTLEESKCVRVALLQRGSVVAIR